ncbi:MAG: hypothetical protein Edafosvirus3_94 [Edafosvirus sp.]|uniref:Uncharacterized protein n=1 Tax=Edafosvirus sp. TaxID=2487765 RepID=A0A3G4ZSZ3_9VIRU|nr:MAG: hypothetical protein Edafosvirus3_94 [Edafosvirus sp.]
MASEIKIDWNTKARKAVELLYAVGAGNSFRARKNGSPEALVTKIIAGKDISTVGLYSLLSLEDRKIIDTKDDPKDRGRTFEYKRCDHAFMQRVAKLILAHEKSKNPAIFVKLSERGKITLQTIASGKFEEVDKKMKGLFKVRTIFENAERQKCRLNAEKKIIAVAEKPKVIAKSADPKEEKKAEPKKE